MQTLSIDIETYSSNDLTSCGVYKYAEADDFEILLFGYSQDHGPVQVVDLASGEKIPEKVLDALTDPGVRKWAFNANFERICLSRCLHDLDRLEERYLSPEGWYCTMIWSAYLGLPLSLAGAGAALGLDRQKMAEGKELIRFFCRPCNPTRANGGRIRNRPEHDPVKWKTFLEYNRRDVEVEASIQEKLRNYPVPEDVWDQYHIDQLINDRGIKLDMELVTHAIRMDEESKQQLSEQIRSLTGLENPNSVQQMKAWLSEQGLEADTLGKKAVAGLLETCSPELKEVLRLRQQLSKSSVKKYTAMQNAVCSDGRARGMFQFYGANRTGRFSGKLIQLQNLPQNHLQDLDAARNLVKSGDFEMLRLLYDDVPDVLSQLIRTAFVPSEGYKFIVSDFAAIEARVIAWLAGEQWRLQVFREGGDIYCASASAMFHVPVKKHGINGHLRQKGKIAELALGYGGSVGALKAMGAIEMGLTEEELPPLVEAWRGANPAIVQLWQDVDAAVKEAVKGRTETEVKGIQFQCTGGMLFITLQSGRRLSYVRPKIEYGQRGREIVTYMGIGATKKWERLSSYGPKFVENIVQGISRDILCYAMKTLRDARIVAHVHDELIIECRPKETVEEISGLMARTPPWAPGLLLRADGDELPYYQKA